MYFVYIEYALLDKAKMFFKFILWRILATNLLIIMNHSSSCPKEIKVTIVGDKSTLGRTQDR